MTIGVNLKAIVKNYSLCEKLFREDYKDNNYTKGILDFFSIIEINSDIIHDLKRLKKEGNKIDLYVPNYLVYDNEKIMKKVNKVEGVDLMAKLFGEIATKYEGRQGGYTRILKCENRKGDNAPEVILELI